MLIKALCACSYLRGVHSAQTVMCVRPHGYGQVISGQGQTIGGFNMHARNEKHRLLTEISYTNIIY